MGKFPFSDEQDERREGRRPNRKNKYYRMPKKTSKLKTEEAIYKILEADYLLDHPYCECGRCRTPENPLGAPATEVHHKKGRGKWLNVVEFFLAVCRRCHEWVETHPKEARAQGFTLSRHSITEDVPKKQEEIPCGELPFKE